MRGGTEILKWLQMTCGGPLCTHLGAECPPSDHGGKLAQPQVGWSDHCFLGGYFKVTPLGTDFKNILVNPVFCRYILKRPPPTSNNPGYNHIKSIKLRIFEILHGTTELKIMSQCFHFYYKNSPFGKLEKQKFTKTPPS